MTALAASIGTGNIAGVATAVVAGGPGAMFWIWCYGFFATSIKFAEAVLGLKYRVPARGSFSAGPMYYLRDGLHLPRLAKAFAIVAAVAALTTTPLTQPNSIALVLHSQFHVPVFITGIGLACLTWAVVIRGIKSIGHAAERLAPLKVGLYLVGGLVVILSHASRLPEVFALILRDAFSLRAATGSAAGIGIIVAMRYGLARGAYANEAGLGTAAVAYGAAKSEQPLHQGLNAVMEVFIISFITSSVSGLAILVTGVWHSGATSTAVVAQAFEATAPVAGGVVVALCIFLFGYTALIGWAYYGEQFFEYFLGSRVTGPYRWMYCLLIIPGAMAKVETVWAWGDLMNALQVVPNIVGLVGLSGIVAMAARKRRATEGASVRIHLTVGDPQAHLRR